MDDLKTVLGRILPAPNQAIIPASSTQTLDRHRKTHPSTLQEWSTFPEEVLNHKANKKPTQPRFVSSQRSYRVRPVSLSFFFHGCLPLRGYLVS